MLNAEQREYMIHRVREIRGYTGGKPISASTSRNDGEYIDGCIAGGRQYAHINPAGDVEPASLSTTPTRTSTTRACWSACSSRCSRSTTRASPSTTTTCAPARCSRTPSCWVRWSSVPVPTAPICSNRNLRTMFSAAAAPTLTSGLRPLTASGPRSTPIALPAPAAPPAHPSKIA